ncbi:hypothetical protein E4898_02160 [Salmonella enterica subsp. enterica serovar Anatum]|uniref:Uncharacterized protein n=2 Tax=Salmonella enterica TaxID=28901 RepID=A0A606NP84_SALAN|nr:hypothetical protein [Salmonella enterica]EAM4267049.1 hypothetical protein [Salmonella enterica subsp. enterica serovar Muenchen]EAW1289522.1 hypothetical protein [Salmonella enterica subsp. enterica]EBV5994642.1 hypothetical protein [Salmonella enterica subsp. enterica serovar Ohio]ECO0921610.1 hypothetical protein [Salmonella enterica subsp. enterica serovar Infantis]ECS3707860.1 hypothetical protein [Salmonella enterica subsp. enterica serovar Agona]ECU3834203.1 hypothetical protein [S
MTNIEKLEKIGTELFGPKWITPMARVIGVNELTIRRWLSGKSRVSTTIASELPDALARKFQTVLDIANSDKMRGDDVTIEMIAEIAERYEFADEQNRKAAIDEMNNAVYEVTYLSDLESIAKKWANQPNK